MTAFAKNSGKIVRSLLAVLPAFPVSFIMAVIIGLLCCSGCTEPPEDIPPNVLFIMADDLGYGELGVYGQQKIETPNIDQLARSGMRFTQYYSGSPVCAPSRCILLSGQHSGHAAIRGNDEMANRGPVWDYLAMAENPYLEGQVPMPDSIRTIAEVLKEKGYGTALFGKWGLGYPGSFSTPNKQGFDYFFGYNCQRQAHTLTPLHLWRNENRVFLKNDTLAPRTLLDAGKDPYDPKSYQAYDQEDYAPSLIFEDLVNYLDRQDDRPFCIFWESPIPHVPLQAPKDWIDYYVDKFGEESPYLGDKGYFPSRYPRATYAAMVSYLDENIGKVIKKLEDKGMLDNTIIIFTSDNGPSYAGGTDSEWFKSAGPFNSTYGWTKGFLKEGGIRVPLIISWPGKIQPGSITDHICAAQDLYPTLCEVAGIKAGASIDGISFKPVLTGESMQPEHPYLYWEFPEYGGQQAVRKGNLKAYLGDIHNGNTNIEVFDLETDIREEHNIADQHPAFVAEVKSIFNKEHIISDNTKWQYKSIDYASKK